VDSPTALAQFPVENDGLYRRLVWTTLLRIALVSALLSVAAALLFRAEEKRLTAVEQALFAIVIGTYAASLAYLLILRSAKAWRGRLAYVQVVGDVLIAACLVWLTGGTESILLFMFPLAVVTAAVLLYRRGAIFAALLSSVALGVVAFGLRSGFLPAPSAAEGQAPMPLPRMAFFLFAHASAVFLSAALASYLAEQLRSTRERLTVREHDYLALERLNESIVRSVSSGIVTADRDGRVTYLNRAAEEICGFMLDQAQGEPIEKRLPALATHLRVSGPERFEAEHHTASGERRRLGFAVAALYDRDGTSQGHVVAVEDLTSIRAMEEGLKRSEKLAAVGALAAGLAHELRNPLASMSGSIELLHGTAAFGDEERRLMGIVLREADRLNALVRDFLRFAKPTPGQLEPLDLGELAHQTVTLFRNDPQRRQVTVEEALGQPLPVVADSGQLSQVLWNLLVNAAEAMPGGGTVQLRGRVAGGSVLLEVQDEGPGIADEDLPHVFEPFYTTKVGGTGLGLAIVHAIVQSHGGEVQVQVLRGKRKGAMFVVKLPLHPPAASALAG
jgi:two-component system sensor histidine kinase PilS (NtrC family)